MPNINPATLTLNAQGDQVKAVQVNLTKVGVTVPVTEATNSTLGPGTVAAVKQFQTVNKLPVTGTVDTVTQTMLTNVAAAATANQSHLGGQLIMEYGLPANGVTVRLYSIAYGGVATKLAESPTDANGVYSLAYTPPASGANIEARAVDSQGNETTVSSIVYNAPAQLALNLVAPASMQPMQDEYQRLSADVQGVIGGSGIQNLANAQENDTQRDLTLLNQSTGWDARLLALAATAAQQTATTGLGPDVLYALYRTGLPSDPQTLALLPAATIGTALTTANQAGIATMSAVQIASAQTAFTTFAAKTNLARKITGAPSSYGDLLGSVVTDAGQQAAFAGAFFDPTVSGADLWNKAAAAGIPADKITALQLQGKLSFLTLNNASLTRNIQTQLGATTDPAALADKDFHLDVTWTNTIKSIAGNDPQKLQALIPTTYGGDTPDDQLVAYSADLARKVRVSFPTRVIARMAETGNLNLDATVAPKVGAFLRAADSAGYQLGRTPLGTFLKNLPSSVPAPDAPTIEQAKTLHRLYQITPSNESLQSSLKLGFTSARDITAYRPDEFRSRFGPAFPSLQEADLVYKKAQQVSAVTLNLFTAAKQLDAQPAMYAMTAPAGARQAAKDAITEKFPSMTGLFGSLDFCDCQDCRSVLSPAAYLVDILHFLDPDDWPATLTAWKNSHNNQDYPFGTPFAALTARRPDLPNLSLSCENTNTALPYIDLVNEILEYFVANQGSLQNMVYDTGAADSSDLIAEPQNILPPAYSVLANRAAASPATYPSGLPFDLWLETVRGFLNYFKLPLGRILEVFRPADSLELLTDANHYAYYRSAIFLESLGFTPAEFALLTNQTVLSNWFNLYGYGDQPTALSELKWAKTLAGRLAITYQELTSILETGFLNPSLVPLTIPLRKFGLSLSDVFNYTGQAGYSYTVPPPATDQKTAFEAKLQKLMQQYYPNSDPATLATWLGGFLTGGYSAGVLVLNAPSENACDFQHTAFQHADGSPANNLDFLKLVLFVRIWKKLGWTIDEVDRAMQLFLSPWLPAANDPNLGKSLANAIPSALIYLSHLQDLFAGLQPGPYGRTGLLPIWSSPIPTTGENPLYAQMFLTDAVLNNDSIFDSPAGQYLCYFDTTQKTYLPFRWPAGQTNEDVLHGCVLLNNHVNALQGAFGLTASDVQSILSDNNLDPASAPLTLANVSLLYRYAILAEGLQLSVDDLIALKQMSVDQINTPPLNAINPFDALTATQPAVLKDDHPWCETLQFFSQAAKVQASGFLISDLQYILRHKIVDPAGPYNQDPAVVMQQVRSLAAIIQSIRRQTAVPADPTTFNDDIIRQKMSQVFPATVAQTFIGMWTGSIQYTASPVNATSAVPAAVFSDQPTIQLVYDPVLSTQTIILQGVPVAPFMTTLTNELGTLVTHGTITAAQQTLLQGLLNDVHTQAQTFFQTYLQQSPPGDPPAGFLQAGDFDTLFAVPSGSAAARAMLASEFLPYLQKQLVTQAISQSLAAQLGTDASLTKTLLSNTAVLFDPTQPPAPPTPLLAAFQAAGDTGVSITYFSGSAEEKTTQSGTATLPKASTDMATNPNKPATVNSARLEGYLEVPADGPYKFTALLPGNTPSVALQFDFMTTPLAMSAGVSSGTPATFPFSGATQLKAGIPYHFTVDFQNLGGGDAQLLVQGESLPLGTLDQLTLYPETSVQRYNRAQILLAKTLQLIKGFKLDENEVAHIATHAADFGNVSFSALPTQSADDSTAGAQQLFGQFLRLANYADLRNGPAGGTDGLIDVFQNARQAIPASPLPPNTTALQLATQNFYQPIANLTRRDVATIRNVITQLWGAAVIQTTTTATGSLQFNVAPLVNDLGFRRLWEALQMVQTLGVQPQMLGQTTAIVNPARAAVSAAPDPGSAIASAFRNAVRSQYTPDQWRPVAQSVFDPLRQMKRDALCAYILTLPAIQAFGVTDTNGLFEFFLVDPGMEPVVQTSRIRLALSSVQTFIQRCLLNLEPQVKPSVIDSNCWEWMKRYRVWEANREIFLWPENWLIPEFRENATDLFQALQGTLLQGNITQDLVEQAFTQYLQDLDIRARLDIVSVFNQAAPAGAPPASNVLHVLGRHHGKPRKYFYRTYANGIWEGWVPVTPDIEGDHVVAVIWRGRLTVFWLTFVVQGGPSAAMSAPAPSHSDGTTNDSKLTDLSFGDLAIVASSAKPPTTVQIQLNWSEYYQQKWTPRKSSDLNRFAPHQVGDDFDPVSDIYVHASIDTDANGEETAVRIHMDFGKAPVPLFDFFSGNSGLAFRLTGKNSEPVCSVAYWQGRYFAPYATSGFDATKDVGFAANLSGSSPPGSAIFQASYWQELTILNGQVQTLNQSSAPILQSVNSFNLLSSDNLPQPVFQGTTIAELASSYYTSQIEALSCPFFYEDTSDPNVNHELTFFVQPTVNETTVTRWSFWAIPPRYSDLAVNGSRYWNVVNLTPQVPFHLPSLPDPVSVFQYQPNVDSIANKSTLVAFGNTAIGQEGAASVSANLARDAAFQVKTGVAASQIQSSVNLSATTGAGARVISGSGLDLAGALLTANRAQSERLAMPRVAQ